MANYDNNPHIIIGWVIQWILTTISSTPARAGMTVHSNIPPMMVLYGYIPKAREQVIGWFSCCRHVCHIVSSPVKGSSHDMSMGLHLPIFFAFILNKCTIGHNLKLCSFSVGLKRYHFLPAMRKPTICKTSMIYNRGLRIVILVTMIQRGLNIFFTFWYSMCICLWHPNYSYRALLVELVHTN